MTSLSDSPKADKKIIKFLTQCHRIAPSINAIQAAMLFALYNYSEPMTQKQLCSELGIKPGMSNRYLKPLFDRSGREMVIMKGWDHLALSDRGTGYCRSLLVNMKYAVIK